MKPLRHKQKGYHAACDRHGPLSWNCLSKAFENSLTADHSWWRSLASTRIRNSCVSASFSPMRNLKLEEGGGLCDAGVTCSLPAGKEPSLLGAESWTWRFQPLRATGTGPEVENAGLDPACHACPFSNISQELQGFSPLKPFPTFSIPIRNLVPFRHESPPILRCAHRAHHLQVSPTSIRRGKGTPNGRPVFQPSCTPKIALSTA